MNGKLDEQLHNAYQVAELAVALAREVPADAVAVLHPDELRDAYLERVCDDDVCRELLWREVFTYGQ